MTRSANIGELNFTVDESVRSLADWSTPILESGCRV